MILEDTRRTAKVSGFTSELGKPITVPIVTAAVAYDCEYSGMTYIMVIHNALYFKNMDVNLIPPFMMRLAGLEVNECPKFLAPNPTIENHSIYFPVFIVKILTVLVLKNFRLCTCFPPSPPATMATMCKHLYQVDSPPGPAARTLKNNLSQNFGR